MAQDIFQRVEVKYILSEQQYEELMKRLEPYMQVDEYGLSTITSLYYDTDTYDIVRESMEKPVYKEKLRLRAYGEVREDKPVFLELKKKFKGVVYKRRIELTYQEAKDYLEQGILPDKDSQILREIDYFIRFYQPHNPTLIAYERTALFGREDRNLRITVDQDVRTKFCVKDLMDSDGAVRVLKPGERLMEIKVPGIMPLWLTQILSDLKIYPTGFSKIGAACGGFLLFDTKVPAAAEDRNFITVQPSFRKETILC